MKRPWTLGIGLWTLLFLELWTWDVLAATRYVSKTGNNSNACSTTDSAGTNKQTVVAGVGCMSAGDTLLIHTGTYTEQINGNTLAIPSGTSWATATTIGGVPGDTVTFNGNFEIFNLTNSANPNVKYVIFQDFIVDGTLQTAGSGNIVVNGPTFLRFQRIESKNSWNLGIIINGASGHTASGIEVLYCDIHDNGRDGNGYSFYAEAGGIKLDHCLLYHNLGQGATFDDSHSGLHSDNNIVTNNRVYNAQIGAQAGGGCLSFDGTNNLIANNLIYGNAGNECVTFGYNPGSSGNKFYNNTVFHTGTAIYVGLFGSATGTDIRNNIIRSGTNTAGTVINNGTSTVFSNNLGCGTGCASSADPQVVNFGGLDFHLQTSSPAKDAGVTLSDVTLDFDGFARPQGSAYDIGAYEFIQSIPPPLSTISMTYPNGGENLISGTPVNITWTSNDTHTVKLEVSRDGGTTYPETIVTGIAQTADANNSYTWIPTPPRILNAKIRVTNLFDLVSDESNAACNIRGQLIK